MTNSLMGTSQVILFGNVMTDLKVRPSDSGGSGGAFLKDLLSSTEDVTDNLELNVTDGQVQASGTRDSNAAQVLEATVKGASATGVQSLKITTTSSDTKAELSRKQSAARVARIMAFSYCGAYYELDSPVLFIVHGDGVPLDEAKAKLSASTGLAALDFDLSTDLSVWTYDQSDFLVRLDATTGPLEEILLDPDGSGGGAAMSGARVSGARVSGARVSGARVSGARVSGARVSGARVSGARLSGNSD